MTAGILSGPAIEVAIAEGHIEITPYNPKHVNPASYDVTLGRGVRRYTLESTLDAKKDNPTVYEEMADDGFVLQPGFGYLLHTEESIWTDRYVPVLDGKSSIGRLFITIHVTAGFGDSGFRGQYTLETVVVHPVRVYPDMRFGQMRFHTLAGEPRLYEGNYTGAGAMGPVASRSWKQFKDT